MEKTETALTITEVTDILDSMTEDATVINPRIGEALELAVFWLGLTEVKDLIERAGLS